MALNFVHPPEVFDLSSLARALDEDVAARTHVALIICEPMDVDVVPPPPPVQYMDVDPTPWPAELDLQPWCIVPPRPLVHGSVLEVRRTNKPTEELPAWAVILPDLPQATPTFDGFRRTISSRTAEKAPVRDVPPEVAAVEAVAEETHAPPPRIDMINMASTSKVKLEDMPPCTVVIRPSKPLDLPSRIITFKSAGENRPEEQQINGNTHMDQPVANVIQNEVLDVEMVEAEISFVSVDIVQPQMPLEVTTLPTPNPIAQSNIFNQEIPHQAVDDHCRMISDALNHNIENDSVMFEDDYVDYSHLPTEYMDLDFPLSIVSAPGHSGHDSPGHIQPVAMECDPSGSPVSHVLNDEEQSSEQQAEDQEIVAEQEEIAQDEPNTCSSDTEESGTAENGEEQAEEDGEQQGEEREQQEDGEQQGEEREEEEEEEESEEERKARVAQLLTEIFGDGEDSDDEEEDRHRLVDSMDTTPDHCSATSEDSSSGDSHSMTSDTTTETTECSTIEDPSIYTDAEGDRLIAANDDGFVDTDAPWLSIQFTPNTLDEDRVQDMGCLMDEEVATQSSLLQSPIREESGTEEDEGWEEYEGEEEEEESQSECHAQLLEDIFGDDEEDEQVETEEEECGAQPEVKTPPKVASVTVTRDPRLRRKG